MRFGGRALLTAAVTLAVAVTLLVPAQDHAAAPVVSGGLWISKAELASLPMSGPAWDSVKAAADGSFGKPDISNLTSKHDVLTLAAALVFARTGDEVYRRKAAAAILAGMASGKKSAKYGALARARNVISYVISADLIEVVRDLVEV